MFALLLAWYTANEPPKIGLKNKELIFEYLDTALRV